MGVRRAAIAGHLHPQLPAVKHGAVHGVHSVFGVALVVEAHEGEATGLLGVAIAGDVDITHPAVLLKDSPQSVGRGAVCQVVHLQGGHPLHVWGRTPVTHGRRELGPKAARREINALGGPARAQLEAAAATPTVRRN